MTAFYDINAAAYIDVDAEVRYWEDASVNGVSDEDGTLIFGREGEFWKVRIDLTEGRIQGWPSYMTADICYKVCDQGIYWLSDEDGTRLAKWKGDYVPNDFLCHGGQGYGDYIILQVTPDGKIENYERPEIDPAKWEPLEVNPHATIEG